MSSGTILINTSVLCLFQNESGNIDMELSKRVSFSRVPTYNFSMHNRGKLLMFGLLLQEKLYTGWKEN